MSALDNVELYYLSDLSGNQSGVKVKMPASFYAFQRLYKFWLNIEIIMLKSIAKGDKYAKLKSNR